MTQPSCETREIWTTGKRRCTASIDVFFYPDILVATADGYLIEVHQVETALHREFPRHTFVFNGLDGDNIRADAERFADDGV